jgi:hypothetical protein
MTSRADLSSLVSALDELNRRVTGLADAAHAAHLDDEATELFAIERSLNAGLRRLRRMADQAR